MINSDRRKTHKAICVIEDKDCPDTLGELFEWVQECVQNYGKDARVALETPSWENDGHCISVYQFVPKTKEELEADEYRQTQYQLRQEQQQRAEYERLRKLYDRGE